VINFNTLLRAVCTGVVVCLLTGTGWAQSVLNFTPVGSAGIAITNTTPYTADVRFTLYSPTGAPVSSETLTNNTSYRIPAMGQFAMMSAQIFRAKGGGPVPEGWIQATSSVTGLQGISFSGDFPTSFDGAEALTPFALQTIPYIPSGPGASSTVIVTNPGAQTSDVTVLFFNPRGEVTPEGTRNISIAPRAQVTLPGAGASVRIEARSGAVLATAFERVGTAVILVNGQAPDTQFVRVIPYFRNRPDDGVRSALYLTNPSASVARPMVFYVDSSGARPYQGYIPTLPPNGTEKISWEALAGPIPVSGDGWIRVESLTPITGVAVIDSGGEASAIPLQSTPSDRILLSRAVTQSGFATRLSLVGDAERDAVLTITLNRPDGTTAAINSDFRLPRLSRALQKIQDLVPSAATFDDGFITIRSSVPIFSAALMDLYGNTDAAVVTPQRMAAGFSPGPVAFVPQIEVKWDGELGPGVTLNIGGDNISNDAILFINGQQVPMTATSLIGGSFTAQLPAGLDPGAVIVKVRSNGIDSVPRELGVLPNANDVALTRELRGAALFQKVEVTDTGLDLSRLSMVPIRNARVEIFDRGVLVSVTETNELGAFSAKVPDRPVTVRVVSKLRSLDLKVLNNTDGNKQYVLSKDVDSFDEPVELVETSRSAGAFNILDAIQKGNALLTLADYRAIPPPLTVYWSEKNTNRFGKASDGLVGTTFFNLPTNTAYVLGDRTTDSDEFDDAVILHEYAHMLAARFSRDDSNGGPHLLGDLLDPRLAWSEGWANFFSSAARGSSIYRDSKGPNGAIGVRYDLEENDPPGNRPGYSSEASIQGLLWDLIDENADNADTAQFSFVAVWNAFTDLRNDRMVYLPYFLQHFLQRNAGFSDDLRMMVIQRNIDFQPDANPNVTNPFPFRISAGEEKTGEVDSYSTKRTNLATSAHFYSFATTTGGQFLIRLDLDGLGPANNPNFNDLDLFLYDSTGKKVIDFSDKSLNGQRELIPFIRLAAGTYVIEVRSFYTRQETNSIVYNSGKYRLAVQAQ